MVKALLARGLTTAVSALMGVLTARLILGNAGVEYFALYALITTLPSLMQFQDLGAGAALVNRIATSGTPDSDPGVVATMMSVLRIMLVFATCVMAANIVLFITDGWAGMLGDVGKLQNASLAAFTCFGIWAISIPFGIWQRILLGLRMNHMTILVQGLMAPINYLLVWAILQTGNEWRSALSLASYVAGFLVAAIGVTLAFRRLPHSGLAALRDVPSFRRVASVKVMDVGWPMLAQMLSAPLSITAQRYILAQSAPTESVAEYTAAAQVYLSLLGVISAAGIALWPHFARQRELGTLNTGPFKLSTLFGLGAVAANSVLFLFNDPLFSFTTNHKVEVHSSTALGFGLMITLQALLYPLGMFIMDKPGIRFQLIPTLAMAFGSFLLAVMWTPVLGVPGPLIANAIAVALAQLLPFTIYILRHRDRLWRPESA